MAFEFHKDKDTYIKWQYENAKNYVIPFIERFLPIKKGLRVMEVGCAEGGVLKAFTDKGCFGFGVELQDSRLKRAEILFEEELKSGSVKLISKNVYDMDLKKDIDEKFDLIILKDVIEHIFDQDKFLKYIRDFLKPNGHIFFGFPPWQMPFGGHQQLVKNKFLSKLPYYHLLPMGLYKSLLKIGGESEVKVEGMMEIKETGISIERFEKLCKKNNYSIPLKQLYLVNPIYKYKFNLEPKNQFSILAAIPYFRNYWTTCAYYLVQKE